MARRKPYSAAFKSKVAFGAIQGDLTFAEVSGKFQISPTLVSKWK